MRKLFIPTIGTTMVLAKDWTFKVINEHRNETLIEWMGQLLPETAPNGEQRRYPLGHNPKDRYEPADGNLNCTLPKGSTLKIDRIYIRKNLDEYDSVTFLLAGAKTVKKELKRVAVKYGGPNGAVSQRIPYIEKIPARGVRFFAKLDDVNTMVIK